VNLLRIPKVISILSVKAMVMSQCLSRNLLVREVDEIETVVYEPTGNVTNSNDDVRISNIQLAIVRCSYTTVRDED